MINDYESGPVIIDPVPVQSGDKIHVVYGGLLVNSGADRIFLHFGYDGWKDTQTLEMTPDDAGNYSATVRASADRRVDLCFKDSADHWDNHNGLNWRCKII